MSRSYENNLLCSFCSKWQKEVKKLISGPDVLICNECIDICNQIIRDDDLREESKRAGDVRSRLPKPVEIKEHLDQYVLGTWRTSEAKLDNGGKHTLYFPCFFAQRLSFIYNGG